MKAIKLSAGFEALVDDEDFEYLSQFKWRVQKASKNNRTNYGARSKWINGKKTGFYLHREIMARHLGWDALKGMTVDHIDGNGLNNSKSNLRVCPQSLNTQVRGLTRKNSSGFKGVTWHKGNKRWYAAITFNGKTHFLGVYRDKIVAAKAYDRAAIEFHGSKTHLNFPNEEVA